jgi:hypothetical protein
MESALHSFTIEFSLCEEKAAKVMRWVSGSEDISRSEFAIIRLFKSGVLPENTRGFLHSLLELQFPGERVNLELPPEQLHALISDAFAKTYLYLSTPQVFLSDFLSFGKEDIIIKSDMLTRLSYLIDYPYFSDMIDEWLGIQLQSGANEIPMAELREIISRIDHTVFLYSPIEKIIDYLKPFFEFHNDAKVLPAGIVHSFLSDKQLLLPTRLEREEFTSEDIAYALKEALLLVSAKESEEELPVPEYGEFLKELREIGVNIPSPNNKIIAENTLLPPIQLFISEKLRAKCIEKIFHGNTKEYERGIGLLNAAGEYLQAELNLRTLLDMYKIPEDAKVSRRLHRALRLRFNIPQPALI